ncbi:MAG TPA: hypothetical protein VFZ09_10770 [Archangium sp.]|uniref:hypothetical protein n=1 Tax=Archangium sp. TaxID=1872627 RepID=UPI002E37924E|nr:hypothetical protein [Archangium sp.]HEX5746720.1 hypothetical protein [Archangium sp.]
MLINQSDYERCFGGFTIIDCAIRNRNIFYFVTLSDYDEDQRPPADEDRTTRVVVYFAERPANKRWTYVSYEGYAGMRAGASQRPNEKFIGIDRGRQVVTIGGGALEKEQDIPTGRRGPARGGIRKIRTIDGLLHVCTGYRGLARRDDRNQWTSLCTGLDFTPDPDVDSGEYGFDDFDAFDPNDFYCVGGKGDVWHFDGNAWERIEFPSNMVLETVCCAGDGWVYISGTGGNIWKGRRDNWKLIHRDQMALPFKDMVWFQDRVYCTSDYGLWEIVGDELRECDVPPQIKISSGNLAVADGVMLLAGAYGCSYYDGLTWKHILDTAAFSPVSL